MNERNISRASAADDTLAWLKKAVVGLSLCPFAAPVVKANRLDIVISDADEKNQMVADVDVELMRLAELAPDELETTLLVFTHQLASFDAFNNFLDVADALLAARGFVGTIQIASFHPDYCFDDVDENDSGNWTNRSPWPTLHLLRESSIERAVQAHPDVSEIPKNNRARLASLDRKSWQRIFNVSQA